MGTEFPFGKLKKFWRLMVVRIAQQSECTSYLGTAHLKNGYGVKFCYKNLFLNKIEVTAE